MNHLKETKESCQQDPNNVWQAGEGIVEKPFCENEYLFLYSDKIVLGKPLITKCSYCGRIRDLVGNWHQLEVDDSVTISHSYCDKCPKAELDKLKGTP